MPAKIELEPLTALQQDLVVANLGFCYHTVNRFTMLSDVEREKLEEFCLLGMFRAAATYDPNHPSGAKFITHAGWKMRQAVSAFFVWLNRQNRGPKTVSLEAITEGGEEASNSFEVADPHAADPAAAAEQSELLARSRRHLTRREKVCLYEHYCEGRSMRDIGSRHGGLSAERVRQLIVHGLERAREGVRM